MKWWWCAVSTYIREIWNGVHFSHTPATHTFDMLYLIIWNKQLCAHHPPRSWEFCDKTKCKNILWVIWDPSSAFLVLETYQQRRRSRTGYTSVKSCHDEGECNEFSNDLIFLRVHDRVVHYAVFTCMSILHIVR